MPVTTTYNLIEGCTMKGEYQMLKICLSGLGRTGSQLAKYLLQRKDVQLVFALCSPDSPKAGRDIGEVLGYAEAGIPVYPSNQLESCIFNTKPDVVIDFSNPAVALKNAEIFAKMNVKIVMGTTGFTKFEEAKLLSLITKNKCGILYAPNITRGVNTMMFLTELASKVLGNYDIEIIEMHHKRKLDSPSGTAVKMARELRESRNAISLKKPEDIPVLSVRAGGIVGNHKVLLVGENDMIEITHQSFSRDAFAEGALYAAEFIADKVGAYEMKDAMNYKKIIEDYLDDNTSYSANLN